MIRSLIILLLLAQLPALEVLGVDYSQDDKRGHFVLGAGVAAISMEAVELIKPDAKWYTKAAAGVVASAVVGALKEWSDSKDPLHHCVEKDDFVATATGGAVVAFTLCWKF